MMKKEPTLKAEFISKIHEIEKQKVIKVNDFAKRYHLLFRPSR